MAGSRGNIGFDSFVALGDSFTEGLSDLRADGSLRGWADRFAERAAEVRPGLRYANLAVRGKVLRELADEQLPRAIGMRPDLVSVAVGGNAPILTRWPAPSTMSCGGSARPAAR